MVRLFNIDLDEQVQCVREGLIAHTRFLPFAIVSSSNSKLF